MTKKTTTTATKPAASVACGVCDILLNRLLTDFIVATCAVCYQLYNICDECQANEITVETVCSECEDVPVLTDEQQAAHLHKEVILFDHRNKKKIQVESSTITPAAKKRTRASPKPTALQRKQKRQKIDKECEWCAEQANALNPIIECEQCEHVYRECDDCAEDNDDTLCSVCFR